MIRRQSIIIFISILVVAIIICGAVFLFYKPFTKKTSPTTNTPIATSSYQSRQEALKTLFADKLWITPDLITIDIARETPSYIKGIVSVKGSYEGIFLAKKTDTAWEIVWDGKTPYTCQDVAGLSFPTEMTDDCQ
jgi:hypothetical protein